MLVFSQIKLTHKLVDTFKYYYCPRTWSCLATIRPGALMCLGTNMSRHNHVWAQACLGTNVSGNKCVWAQTCLGTNVCGYKCVWAQTCVGTNVCRHKRVWAQTSESTNVSGHKRVWAQSWGDSRVGPIMYRHKRGGTLRRHLRDGLGSGGTAWRGVFRLQS